MNIETILQQIALSKQRNDGTIYVKTNELSQATIDQLIQMGYQVKHFQFEYTQISL